MKKLLSLCVIVAATLSPLQMAAASPGALTLRTMGIIQGRSQGDLALDQLINRAELLKILVNVAVTAPLEGTSFQGCFQDVQSEWFAAPVCWAKGQKYVTGYANNVFLPGQSVTLAEALKMTMEVFHIDLTNYRSGGEEWFMPYVSFARGKNIWNGSMDALAKPVTRGEVFDIVARTLALQELDADMFEDALYPRLLATSDILPANIRGLSKNEQHVLDLVDALPSAQTGMISTGSLMTEVAMQQGTKQMEYGIQSTVGVTFSGDVLAPAQELRLAGHIRVLDEISTDDAVKVALRYGLTVRLFAGGAMYLQINDLKIVDAKAPVAVRAGLYELQNALAQFKGIWVRIDDVALQQIQNNDWQSVIKKLIQDGREPILSILSQKTGADTTFSIRVLPTEVRRFLDILSASSQQDVVANKFALRQNSEQAVQELERMLEKLTLTLRTRDDLRLYGMGWDLDEVSFPAGDTTMTLTSHFSQENAFYDSIPLEVPPQSIPLETLMRYFFGSSGEMVEGMNILQYIEHIGLHGIEPQHMSWMQRMLSKLQVYVQMW